MQAAMWMDALPPGIAPILASLHCDYKAQMKFPDTALVGTRVTKIGNSSIRMEHRLVGKNEACVTAEVDSTLVLLDYNTGRPVTVPDSIREAIGRIEGRSFGSAAHHHAPRP